MWAGRLALRPQSWCQAAIRYRGYWRGDSTCFCSADVQGLEEQLTDFNRTKSGTESRCVTVTSTFTRPWVAPSGMHFLHLWVMRQLVHAKVMPL
ncbi:hypothetical protein J6590_087698 [Homalodisca vitripennis]|nr:hypothetical protein J6590_087698 [Homalodisca vitripennis]